MFGNPVEDEGYAVFRLVVNYFRHLVQWRAQVVYGWMRVLND